MKNKPRIKAVVVSSGGQDSTICMALAVRKHGAENVAAVTFSYGQRHSLEIQFAKKASGYFGLPVHKTVDLPFYASLTDNALFNESIPIKKECGATAPTTFVEGRNMAFLLLAGVFAKNLGAQEIWTGVSEADFSGYPDCREVFVKSCQRTMRLAMEWPFKIITPLMHMDKAMEWALAADLGIFDYIRENTLTCYRGIPGDGCGTCPACKLRARGLAEYLKSKTAKRN